LPKFKGVNEIFLKNNKKPKIKDKNNGVAGHPS
jgi:hypothetical protein